MAEIRRAVAKGHKGVIYPASPMELRSVPHINEPAYDPLWATCQELGCPALLSRRRVAKNPDAPWRIVLTPRWPPPSAAWFARSVRLRWWQIFCYRACSIDFPKLKVVFAESSLGWGAYEIEYADYQSDADGLPSEGYALKPSELFQRQCYFTCWYDRESLRVRRYLGIANILWSSHFPLATSTLAQHAAADRTRAFAGVPEDEKRQIQWENAAKLYSL